MPRTRESIRNDISLISMPALHSNFKPKECCSCHGADPEHNPVDNDGLCDYCHIAARNSLREKLKVFLSDPSNFSRDEWRIIFDLRNKILEL